MSGMEIFRIFSAFISLVYGIWYLRKSLLLVCKGYRATGTIAVLKETMCVDGMETVPSITFTDHQGKVHSLRHEASLKTWHSTKVGDQVKIYYLPDQPAKAECADWTVQWGPVLLAFGWTIYIVLDHFFSA